MNKILNFIYKEGLTQSIIKTFFDCKFKFYLKLSGLQLKNKFETKFDFGNICHAILEYCHNNNSFLNDKDLQNFIENYNNTLDIDLKKKIFIVMSCYFIVYKNEFKTKKFIESEFLFYSEYPIFKAVGKIDAIYKIKNNENYLFEIKTKSRIEEEKIIESLSIDFQSLYYTSGVKTTYKPQGVLYDIIRNPQSKNISKEEILKNPNHYFKCYQIIFTKKDIENFEILLKKIFIEIKNTVISGRYTPNYFNCTKLTKCEYLDYCNKHCKQNNNYEIKPFTYKELI
jgi:hypothetical protein